MKKTVAENSCAESALSGAAGNENELMHRNMRRRKRIGYLKGYLFISPICLGLILFFLIPIVFSFCISFTDYGQFAETTMVGFANFAELFTDPLFYKTLLNTLYAALTIVFNAVFSLAIAFFLSRGLRGERIYRTIFYIPSICSVVAVSLVWKWMYNSDFGLLNQFLKLFGVRGPGWLSDERWAMPAMILNGVWSGVGANMILYLAAIKGIPKQYYEAADIDGANGLVKFMKITLPGVSPTTFFILVTTFIGAMQDFSRFMVMTKGGPGNNTTTTIVYYIWKNAFDFSRFGYAAAMSWILALSIGILTFFNFKFQDKWVSYD